MPSAFILSVRSYPAMPLARQLAHQRYVPPNPLVLGRKLRKFPTPTTDRDRPVSRMKITCYQVPGLYHHPVRRQGADVLAACATPLREGASLYGVTALLEILHNSLQGDSAFLGVVETLVVVNESNQFHEVLF